METGKAQQDQIYISTYVIKMVLAKLNFVSEMIGKTDEVICTDGLHWILEEIEEQLEELVTN